MNTPNNKRRKASRARMEKAFVQLLQEQELNTITVTEVCKLAEVNRTTFYANYEDVYALAAAVQQRLEDEVASLYDGHPHDGTYSEDSFLRLFYHIRENQLFYKTYFKLGADGRFALTETNVQAAVQRYGIEHTEYHVEFFRNGLNAILKLWLKNGCRETPEQINNILKSEYEVKERVVEKLRADE